MWGRRILVLVPHPDDEVVACSAAIARAQAQGSEIFALYLTHGCIAKATLWPWQRSQYEFYVARRRQEAEAVAKFLGIKPVGWSARPARHLWQDLPKVYAEIHHAAARNMIDQIWVPAFEGGNADHDALNALCSLLKSKLSVLEFAEYNYFQGTTHSQDFPSPKGHEHVITLTQEEKEEKKTALRMYLSEKQNLNYIDVVHECYRPLASYDYSKPPHPGTLWYTRFQWVPFRHPRVDFTNPLDVAEAITKFLAEATNGLPGPATQ